VRPVDDGPYSRPDLFYGQRPIKRRQLKRDSRQSRLKQKAPGQQDADDYEDCDDDDFNKTHDRLTSAEKS